MTSPRWACSSVLLLALACDEPRVREALVPLPFEQSTFAYLPFHVTDLAWNGEGEERELFVSGHGAWARISSAGEVSVTDLEPSARDLSKATDPQFFDLNGDGEYEIVCPAESWISPLDVYDLAGKRLWSVTEVESPTGTLWHDFDGDGRAEFVIWNGVVVLYSSAGERMRVLASNGPNAAIPWEFEGTWGVLCAMGNGGGVWIAADESGRQEKVREPDGSFFGDLFGSEGYTNHVERIGATENALYREIRQRAGVVHRRAAAAIDSHDL